MDQFHVVLGLDALLYIFLDEDVASVDTLNKLTDDELKGLSIKLGACAKIRTALQVGLDARLAIHCWFCWCSSARDSLFVLSLQGSSSTSTPSTPTGSPSPVDTPSPIVAPFPSARRSLPASASPSHVPGKPVSSSSTASSSKTSTGHAYD